MKATVIFFFLQFATLSAILAQSGSVTITPSGTGIAQSKALTANNNNLILSAKIGQVSEASVGHLFLQARTTGFPYSGNVGIGVSTSSTILAKMQIHNDFATDTRLRLTGTDVLGEVPGLELWVDANAGSKDVAIRQLGNNKMYFETNNSRRVTIEGDGDVGIGTTAPNARLQVVGNTILTGNLTVSGTICSTSGTIVACASDRRFKKDFLPLTGSLSMVNQMQGLHYRWRTNEFEDKKFTDAPQIGFIAQDMETLVPEVVFTDEKGYKAIDYGRLTPVLVEAIKELSAKVNDLQKSNQALLEIVAQLQAKHTVER